MGYEEVETVLPPGFVPRPDPVPVAAPVAVAAPPPAVAPAAPPPAPQLAVAAAAAARAAAPPRAEESESESEGGPSRRFSWRRKTKKKRTKTGGGVLSRWRASRRKTKADAATVKAQKSSSSKRGFRTVRKVDSNETEKRTNTSKAKEAQAAQEEEEEEPEQEQEQELEPPAAPEEAPAAVPAADDATAEEKKDEAGDEHAAIAAAVGIALQKSRSAGSRASARSLRSNKSTKSTKSVKAEIPILPTSDSSVRSARSVKSRRAAPTDAKDAEAEVQEALRSDASVRSTRSNKSTRSAGSRRSVTWGKAEGRDDGGTSDEAAEGVAADPADEARETWVQKVSLSIGGYETSFQFADPATSLAAAVNDALAVAGGGTVEDRDLPAAPGPGAETADAAEDDEDDEEAGEERDYDEDPTALFVHLQRRAWAPALARLRTCPAEARVWVYRRAPAAAAAPATTALVVYDATTAPTARLRWKLLPLHAAIVLGAPASLIQELVRAHPGAARRRDERGSLPVHLAAARLDVDPEGEKVVLQLFGAYPDSIELTDRKDRTPPDLARLARARRDAEVRRRDDAARAAEDAADGAGAGPAGEEGAARPHGGDAGEDDGGGAADADAAPADDGAEEEGSVRSGASSGRFRRVALRKARSTDTVARRKREGAASGAAGLSPAQSVDAGDAADDRSVASSLGPGFALLATSRCQAARESVRRAAIGREWRVPADAPAAPDAGLLDLPLPASFCDDESVRTTASRASVRSTASRTSVRSAASRRSVKSAASRRSTKSAASRRSTKSAASTAGAAPGAASPTPDAVAPPANEAHEGLRALLEKAAENAGRGGLDVVPFVQVLEDEWVTDVEALRLLDGKALDGLLPLMLSRQLQRLIAHADGIDAKFLEEEKGYDGGDDARGPPQGGQKKKKKPRGAPPPCRPATPAEGALTPIREAHEDRAPGGAGAGAPAAPAAGDGDPDAGAFAAEDLEIRKVHAHLIAEARAKFPTRAALEDAVAARQAEVDAAVDSGFDVGRDTLARAARADDEIRRLLPLRRVLPTTADLEEMIGILREHEGGYARDRDAERAQVVRAEIEELQAQIGEEERYLQDRVAA